MGLPAAAWSIAVSAALAASGPSGNGHLARAENLMTDIRYPEALKELEAAERVPGNDRPTLLRILELEGVLAGKLKQSARARRLFQTLLVLDPQRVLSGESSPKVTQPFAEAKAWLQDHAALFFEATPPVLSETVVAQVAVRVSQDTLDLARRVRFHLQTDGPWRTQDGPLGSGKAQAAVGAGSVSWWAELLGERDAVLALVGSEDQPLLAKGAPPVVLEPPPPRIERIAEPARVEPRLRPVAIAMAIGAVGSVGTGAYLGYQSNAGRQQIQSPGRDANGNVTSLTEVQAAALDLKVRHEATAANVLFACGGGMALIAGAVWVWGSPVAVSPAPNGVQVSGRF